MVRKPPANDDRSSNYEVGYMKPPIEHRIRPGFTKNYAGRPKRSKSATSGETDNSHPILREGRRKITVVENGVERQLSVDEAIARSTAAKAIRGDTTAQRTYYRERDKALGNSRLDKQQRFQEGIDLKVAQLVQRTIRVIERLDPDDLPLHPDRIILTADQRVVILPSLQAARDRQAKLKRRGELRAETRALQRRVNEKHLKKDAYLLKMKLNELRLIEREDLLEEMPGIDATVRTLADAKVVEIRGRMPIMPEMTLEEAKKSLLALGLLPSDVIDL